MSEIFLEEGRPREDGGRSEREMAVYALLDRLHIPYLRADHAPAFTMAACEAIDRAFAPAAICKNLFLCNAGKTAFYLLMMPGDKKFRTKDLSAAIGSARLSFAPEEHLFRLLSLTPGSVSVMGLMNDREGAVSLLVDEEVADAPDVVCHPCVNTSSIRLRTADLFPVFLPAVGHTYRRVHLPR